MTKILTICFVALSMNLSAGKLVWYKGAVVLTDDQVLTGEISFEPAHDLILLRTDETLTVYPAHKIKLFNYYDAKADINRKFISLKDNSHVAIRSYHLYEMIVSGEISVLRKPKLTRSKENTYSDNDDFDYFIFRNHEMINLAKFRTSVYAEMLSTNRNQVLSFVHLNNLDPNLPASAIKIIKYYNTEISTNAIAGKY